MNATEILQKMVNLVDSGNAPARGELKPSVDLVDDYYNALLDLLDDARVILAAKSLGTLGGKSTSESKRKASSENGRLGGRPKSRKTE